MSTDLRTELRSATARLLRDDTARACLIAVTAVGGQLWLSIRSGGQSLAELEIPAP